MAIPRTLRTIEGFELGSLTEWCKILHNYNMNHSCFRINSPMPISKLTSIDTLWDSVETQVRALYLERLAKISTT
jgi:membrane-associated HD superfamily phosphohydrolase